MAKTLELQFLNETGQTVRISIDSPIEPINKLALDKAMNDIITSNVFISNGGNFVSKKGARLIDRQVTEIELV